MVVPQQIKIWEKIVTNFKFGTDLGNRNIGHARSRFFDIDYEYISRQDTDVEE